MFSTVLRYTGSGGAVLGDVYLAGGTWDGETMVFEFGEGSTGMNGLIRCDWRRPLPEVELHDEPSDPETGRLLLEHLVTSMAPFHSGAYAGITDGEIAEIYDEKYHSDQGYALDSPAERERKGVLAQRVIGMVAPRRVLVAGCSAGECLRQFRRRGVESWGFDITPTLSQVAYPEVREWVRVGRMEAIPFGPEDGFDTVTALDVLEHLPEDRVPAVVRELVRLGARHLVALVAHCEFNYPGHITLRPLSWWDRHLGAGGFVRVRDCAAPTMIDPGRPDPTTFLRLWRREVP